ncbi:hypothetical protein H257_00411 [Aphanomyces astaci]|uniref:Globin domain-containing protein n=2 Tax=Aphanomyces astaci TaxID=112090 RepID=W4HAD4_APHAT|nr:hypothetical protein H257_00411 [Aphanomyces astaci]ETV88995.1 hypothetical protein H257_00411 [Aphanomyces astaci]|eukprot:XP_009821395.1 hypothetical protein H257_00411 [Aphanomyces astaci]
MGAHGSKRSARSIKQTMMSMMGRSAHSMNDDALMAAVSKVTPDDTSWNVEYRRPLASSDHYHHYMPTNMPLCPIYQESYVQECGRSWKLICKASTPKMRPYNKEGIVLFYDEFFHRLFQRDPGFYDIFPGIRKRIEVLIKAMKFMLNDAGLEETKVIERCRNLGYRHKTIPKVQPHHFAAYAQTFVEVAMYWLDVEATPDVGEAWSNLIGFNLKYMLQAYLHDLVDESAWNQNIIAPVAARNSEDTAKKPPGVKPVKKKGQSKVKLDASTNVHH